MWSSRFYFFYLLAGFIDRHLSIYKAGYTACDIVLGLHELSAAYLFNKYLGGSISMKSGVKALR